MLDIPPDCLDLLSQSGRLRAFWRWHRKCNFDPQKSPGISGSGLGCHGGVIMEYLLIVISTVLVNNIVLVKFLGLCPLMGVSSNLSAAWGMSLATTFVLTLSALASWLIEHLLLVPLHIEFLRILSFILVIAATVQFTEGMVRKASPALHKSLGIYLPLITTNCAVLGVALLNITAEHNLSESLVYGLGSAIGFSVVMVMFAGLRERLALANVPATFAGSPVSLVTAGILSLVFMGFSGMI